MIGHHQRRKTWVSEQKSIQSGHKKQVLNDSTYAKEQHVGHYDAKTLPIEYPPHKHIDQHEVHHKGAKDDVAISHISILTEILVQ